MLLPVMASVTYNVDKNSGRDSSPFSGSSKPWKSGPLIITHFHPPSSPFTLLSQEPQLRESRSVTIWNQPICKAKHSVWQWEDLIKPAVDGCVHRAVRKPLSSHRPTSNCGFTTSVHVAKLYPKTNKDKLLRFCHYLASVTHLERDMMRTP